MEGNENLLSSELQIDSASQSYLAETAKWGKFLAILGFVMTAIIVIISLFASVIFSSLLRGMPTGGGDLAAMGTTFITVLYLVIAAINFFMALYLYKFSTKMKAALYANDQEALNTSFLNLRSMFRLIGVLTAIYIGFIVLALIFGILGAAFR
jgi:Family of unknown function (DUF5362)